MHILLIKLITSGLFIANSLCLTPIRKRWQKKTSGVALFVDLNDPVAKVNNMAGHEST